MRIIKKLSRYLIILKVQMKTISSFLLSASLIISSVNCLCDDVTPMKKLDMDKFAGDWYVFQAGSNNPAFTFPECLKITFSAPDSVGGVVETVYTYDIANANPSTMDLDVKFYRGVLNFENGVGEFFVTYTDYETVASVYKCNDALDMPPTVYLLSRTPDGNEEFG